MNRSLGKMILALSIFFGILTGVSGQELSDLSFRSQPIGDILRVLGNAGEFTVSVDSGIQDRVDFQSPGLDARQAAELLLAENHLFSKWDGDILFVSRVEVISFGDGTVIINAEDAPVQDIMTALAREVSTPILFDTMPQDTLTFRSSQRPVSELLEVLVARFSDYSLVFEDGYAYVKKQRDRTTVTPGSSRGTILKEADDYALNIDSARFLDVLDEMFRQADKEYSYLGRNDSILSRITYRARPFEETLRLLLEQGKCDYIVVGDIYYVFDIQQADVLRRYSSIVRRRMEYIEAGRVSDMFPAGMLPADMLSVDEEQNMVILYGSLEALAPIQDFLNSLDVPDQGRIWTRYDLDYLDPSGLVTLLPPELRFLPIYTIPATRSILVRALDSQHQNLTKWLDMADEPVEGFPVTLRYITAEDLIANLPPAFSTEDITLTQNPNMIHFRGSREKLMDLRESLESLDRPIRQIRYDLLVIHYRDNQQWDWGIDMSFAPGEGTTFAGNLAPLLGLNFDIASTFGYQFALNLSAEISESRAKVVADTTLNGLSGQKLSFRNTSTSRYQDIEQDSNGNLVLSSEKEITSGLFIDIEGWVSGDNMITMDVNTTISKQLDTDSTEVNALPSTSEKIINTQIRTEAGNPVIIGGLTQQEETISIAKTPVLGSIPILGLLFRKENITMENTEFVVYIVPHIEADADYATTSADMFKKVYEKYVEQF